VRPDAQNSTDSRLSLIEWLRMQVIAVSLPWHGELERERKDAAELGSLCKTRGRHHIVPGRSGRTCWTVTHPVPPPTDLRGLLGTFAGSTAPCRVEHRKKRPPPNAASLAGTHSSMAPTSKLLPARATSTSIAGLPLTPQPVMRASGARSPTENETARVGRIGRPRRSLALRVHVFRSFGVQSHFHTVIVNACVIAT
jgi:hypothetical protein